MPPSEDDLDPPYADAPWRDVTEMLAELGFTPVPSAEVNKYELRGRLWELIYAMAGKRLFFFHTDHLSDREFYNWLEHHWLPERAADLPPDSEWNCHVDVSESNATGSSSEKLTLRYYADDATRANWQQAHPGQKIPPHQPLPYHRDQYLPRPHAPITNAWPMPGTAFPEEECGSEDVEEERERTLNFSTEEEGDDEFDETNDPLGLAAVDREIHRQGHGGGDDERDDFSLPSGQDAGGFEMEYEATTLLRPIDVLRQRHFTPLPMAELTESTVAPALWELLHELSRLNFFIVHTDHLTDEALYEKLTRTVLYLRVIIPELLETTACYHDCLQTGSEALELWLKYYATPAQRREWRDAHPNGSLPPAQPLPSQRDWHLPQLPVRP